MCVLCDILRGCWSAVGTAALFHCNPCGWRRGRFHSDRRRGRYSGIQAEVYLHVNRFRVAILGVVEMLIPKLEISSSTL